MNLKTLKLGETVLAAAEQPVPVGKLSLANNSLDAAPRAAKWLKNIGCQLKETPYRSNIGSDFTILAQNPLNAVHALRKFVYQLESLGAKSFKLSVSMDDEKLHKYRPDKHEPKFHMSWEQSHEFEEN